jgi:GGDEF domain-containing protein
MFSTAEMEPALKGQALTTSLYDLYRLVDYKKHEIYNVKNGKLQKMPGHCYDLWGICAPCPNCISKHTCNEHCRHFKMESLKGAVYLIESLPVEVEGKKFSLELADDMTNSLVSRENEPRVEVLEMIREFNRIAVHDPMTGLYNEKYVNDQLQLISLSQGEHVQTVCLAVTLDDIDDIAARCGENLAETVTKRTASVLMARQDEPNVWAGKLKDNSYALFYRDSEPEKLRETAVELAKSITGIQFRMDDLKIHAAASVKYAVVEFGGESSAIDKLDFKSFA